MEFQHQTKLYGRLIFWVAGLGFLLHTARADQSLDTRLLEPMRVKWALGQVESGANRIGFCSSDLKRGRHREVSRYQIRPEVWARETRSRDYTNPELAWGIAERILTHRAQWFQSRTGRSPSPFDLYLIWNAPGYYEEVGFHPARVKPLLADRARRFANLLEDQRAPAQPMRVAAR